MDRDAEELYRLIRTVRTTFQDLRAFSDGMNADLGITAAMRAVLEDLTDHGDATVPEIARRKNVTRQHVQQLSDALVVAGLAEYRENPRHRRSQLVAATALGTKRFREIRTREAAVLKKVAAVLSARDVSRAADTLASLRDVLKDS